MEHRSDKSKLAIMLHSVTQEHKGLVSGTLIARFRSDNMARHANAEGYECDGFESRAVDHDKVMTVPILGPSLLGGVVNRVGTGGVDIRPIIRVDESKDTLDVALKSQRISTKQDKIRNGDGPIIKLIGLPDTHVDTRKNNPPRFVIHRSIMRDVAITGRLERTGHSELKARTLQEREGTYGRKGMSS